MVSAGTMECSNATIPKILLPYAIVQHFSVEYADVQRERADA